MFGALANGATGVLTVCIMVLARHAHWYFMRWHHLFDDAEILVFSVAINHAPCLFDRKVQGYSVRNRQRRLDGMI